MITQQLLRVLFDYDSETGWLIWKSNDKYAGSCRHRYISIGICGTKYYAHRLIWMWHYGTLPEYIDHIDGNSFNNKVENLRECTQTQNLGNADWGDLRGIEQRGNSFRVRVIYKGCRYNYGSFNSLEKAKQIRDEAYILHFGEFARVPQ